MQCLNNERQLATTWTLYAADANEALVPNGNLVPAAPAAAVTVLPAVPRLCVAGDYHNFAPAFTHPMYLVDPRFASFAPIRIFRRSSDIASPAGTFLFMDVPPQSLCTPAFIVLMPGSSGAGNDQYFHLPAAHHNNGGVVSHADGHVENRRWFDPKAFQTASPGTRILHNLASPRSRDLAWIQERTTLLN